MMIVKKVGIIIPNLPEDLLVDFNAFVRVANDLKSLARSCSPKIVEGAVRLEKHRRIVVDSIRDAWLKQGRLDDETAREAIDLVYDVYKKSLREATKELEVCLMSAEK
mgnify:CR=1 FL=1